MKTDIIISELMVGEKLFSTIHGYVTVVRTVLNDVYSIKTKDSQGKVENFTSDGKYIAHNNFPCLFKVSPFKEEAERVVMVKESTADSYLPRVLIEIKNGRAVCWKSAETIEASKNIYDVYDWDNWKEVDEAPEAPKIVELTFQDISNGKGVGIDPKLIKIII